VVQAVSHSVVLKRLRYRNLLSTGNYWVEFDFQSDRTQIVCGENGGGKSTFLDALSYVNFNKPYRDINLPQLINSITNKELLVEEELTVRGKEYLIRRGMKPNIFEIHEDGKLLDKGTSVAEYQKMLEDTILKRTQKTFCQTVIRGSANYIPFMKLKAAERRQVVEDLLDIGVFSTMAEITKDKLKTAKVSAAELDKKLGVLRTKVELETKHQEQLKSISEEAVDAKAVKLAETEMEVASKLQDADATLPESEELREKLTKLGPRTDKSRKYENLLPSIKHKINAAKTEAAFYDKNDVCPTCRQPIEEHFKRSRIDELHRKAAELEPAKAELLAEIGAAKEAEQAYEKEYKTLSDAYQVNQTVRNNAVHQANYLKRTIDGLRKEIADMRTKLLQAPQDDRVKVLQGELHGLEVVEKEVTEEVAVASQAAMMLKDDGIKASVIRQFVPVMNEYLNKYLEKLDLFVDFRFDDNFNESIMSRYRDKFSYHSFSEGQKSRIDLAIMFAWLEVIRRRKSTSFNLLVLDEVLDGSLDEVGLELAVAMFLEAAKDMTIVVVSPKPSNYVSKFDKMIKFKLVKNFSQMEIA
jgi:Kyanoviridae SbcC-like subunit of palindrome specific endonuclease